MTCFIGSGRSLGFSNFSELLCVCALLAHVFFLLSGMVLSYITYVPYYVRNIPGLDISEPVAPTVYVLLSMLLFFTLMIITPALTFTALSLSTSRLISSCRRSEVAYVMSLFSFTVALAGIALLIQPSRVFLTTPLQSPVQVLVGALLSTTYSAMGLAAAGIGCTHNLRSYRNSIQDSESSLLHEKTPKKRHPTATQHISAFIFGLSIIGSIAFASIILPPMWNWPLFDYFRTENVEDSLLPISLWRVGRQPSDAETEEGWVFPMLVPKLYLNDLLFFTVISLLLFIGMLSATILKVRLLLRMPFFFGLNLGETLFSLLLFSLFFFESIYWVFFGSQRIMLNALAESISVSTMGGVYSDSAGYYAFHGAAARVSGHLAALAVSLTLLPAPKTSILDNAFAITTQRAINLHSRLGKLAWALTTSHLILWLVKWIHEGSLFYNVVSYSRLKVSPSPLVDGSTAGVHVDNFTIPIVEVAWTLLTLSLIIGVFMRNYPGWYSFFQVVHPFAAGFFLLSALIHAFGFWKYAALGVILLIFEKIVRAVRVLTNDATIAEINTENGITRLVLNIKDIPFDCGQHVYLSLLSTRGPSFSLKDIQRSIERHPFSIASSPSKSESLGTLSFIIRDRNKISSKESSWTSQVAALANGELSSSVSFSVDGPYGQSFPYRDFETILLIAGGTGISGIIGFIEEILIQQQEDGDLGLLTRVDLIWAMKSQSCRALMAAVAETLYEAKRSCLISLHLFISDSNSDEREERQCDLISEIRGRPRLEDYFKRAGREGRAAAFVVGPGEMARECKLQGRLHNVGVFASVWE